MKTIMDPDEARHFAAFLEETSRDLRTQNTAISRQLLELNVSWKDAKYNQFQHLFEEATEDISRFLSQADEYAMRLREKAKRVDRYLDS
jgi:hypothetical protein